MIPVNKSEFQKQEVKSNNYTIIHDQLYVKYVKGPWLQYLIEEESRVFLNEVHEEDAEPIRGGKYVLKNN